MTKHIGRHALPWSAYFLFRDESPRMSPGRHARNVSPTHVPAWPWNRSAK